MARNTDSETLKARLRIAEEALAAIHRETQHALHHPEISVMTLCRISTLAAQARASLGAAGDPAADVPVAKQS
jgi:hypothetical protein